MEEREVTISNKLGLHARAAAKLVTVASGFDSEVELARDNQKINAKSIMGVMMLAAAKGTKLVLTTSGEDETEAANELVSLIEMKFGEAE